MKIAAILAVSVAVLTAAVLAILLWHGQVQAPAVPEQAAAPSPTPETEPADDAPFTVIEQTEPLTAETLPGTAWRSGPYTFVFHNRGSVTINAGVPGQWRLVGEKVIIEAQTQQMTGELSGTQLLFDGAPAKRIQPKKAAPPTTQVYVTRPAG